MPACKLRTIDARDEATAHCLWRRSIERDEPLPSQHLPNSQLPALPQARGKRWLANVVRRPHMVEWISWLAWLFAVVLFALAMHLYYQTPADPRWIGLTVHTAVFAIWTQVAREWLALYVCERIQRQVQES